MIDWYRLPPKKSLGFILTIATAQRPSTITAGRLVNLSLGTFCSVSELIILYQRFKIQSESSLFIHVSSYCFIFLVGRENFGNLFESFANCRFVKFTNPLRI